MPSELWELFRYNRELLGCLSALAAKVILKLARKKGILPGIFTALHTFGRDLKWNVHVHLSVTRGGLANDNQHWKILFFSKNHHRNIKYLGRYLKRPALSMCRLKH